MKLNGIARGFIMKICSMIMQDQGSSGLSLNCQGVAAHDSWVVINFDQVQSSVACVDCMLDTIANEPGRAQAFILIKCAWPHARVNLFLVIAP